MFVGRQAELRLLRQEWSSGRSAFIPIYGRRRVGKSELILRFMGDKPAVYFVGKQAPPALQQSEFLRQAAVALDEPLLASLPADSWSNSLSQVSQRWRGGKPLVLVLDEFQWMVEQSPELPSVLQELWDRQWKRAGNIMLILCGSFVGFMEREVLGKKSPLFGRRTAQILLRPFGYVEASEFHPNWSLSHRATAYFICGGVPWYLRMFDSTRSPEANIQAQLFDEFAPLFREADFLLREELRDVSSYYAVLVALAGGKCVAKEISQHAGLPERSLHYYLQQLVELGYVARCFPLSGRRPVARHVRYALEDPLLRFWFRFVFPQRSYVAQVGASRVFRERVKPELESYLGGCFERLCREAMPGIYARQGVEAGYEIGEYWDAGVQIDVVGLREDGWTDLGECKWGRVRSIAKIERELGQKIERYPNARGATLAGHVFARKKPKGVPSARWHDLEELYEV